MTAPVQSLVTFDLSPVKLEKRMYVITIAGEKGVGKTTAALSAPGTIGALTFDRKTQIIHEKMWKSDPRIVVFDALRYYSEEARTKDEFVKSGAKNYAYLMALLESVREKYDWMMFDGIERLHEMCEMKMRYENKLGPVEGFSNLSLWKERRYALRAIHNKAVAIAKRGVIYTTHLELVPTEKKDGEIVAGKRMPKWIDVIKDETDVLIHVDSEDMKDGKISHIAKVVTSKDNDFMKEGSTFRDAEVRSLFGGK